MREAVTALAVIVPFALGLASAPADDGDLVFRFQDPAILESSGLVVQDGVFLTTNDSGDTGRVFAVDPDTGRTVSVTPWSTDPVDVEALAPAGSGRVWVGDIGDNARSRGSVTVTRIAVGDDAEEGSAPRTFELVYPDGPTDAETLLAHPVTGRLYVVGKVLFGGTLYAAPGHLSADRPNRLRDVGRVLPIATDGAFFPDGHHVILRDYGRAVVYTFPALEAVGEVRIPAQEQGEGIAVADDGSVFVSSEGSRAPVLELHLSEDLRDEVTPDPASASGTAAAAPSPSTPAAEPGSREGSELPEEEPSDRDPWQWVMGGLLAIGALALVLRATRPR